MVLMNANSSHWPWRCEQEDTRCLGCPYLYGDVYELWRDLDGSKFSWYDGPNLKKVQKKLVKKTMWITELGFKSNDSEDDQAVGYRNFFDGVQEHASFVDRIFLYEMVDDPNNENKWGLLRPDLSKKQSFFAVKSGIQMTA